MRGGLSSLWDRIRKRSWLVLPLVLFILILPSSQVIREDFIIFDYTSGAHEDKTMPLEITLTKHNRLPMVTSKHDVVLMAEGRTYRYQADNFSGRDDAYVPLGMNYFEFGVLLPDKDFSEFVVLFDEDHHYLESNTLKFVVYPQRSESEARLLLEKLLEYNNYDPEKRTFY